MSNCPVCGQEMQDDFGLVNCGSCGSPVLMGMDGEVGLPPAAPSEVPIEEAKPETLAEIIEEPIVASSEVQEEDLGFELPDVPQELPQEPIPDPSDLSDVEEFANSEESSAAEGSLKFNLKISGIDTVDIKTEIKDVLSDSKLHIDPEQTLARIDSGELTLEGLSSVKCAILVQRLKPLPIEINWEQYAIQQT